MLAHFPTDPGGSEPFLPRKDICGQLAFNLQLHSQRPR
jgi:hypothetical protein